MHFAYKVDLYFSTPAVNRRQVEWYGGDSDEQKKVWHWRKIWSDNEKYKMEKIKAEMCWEFDIIKATVQTVWKTEPQLLVCLNGKDRE